MTLQEGDLGDTTTVKATLTEVGTTAAALIEKTHTDPILAGVLTDAT